MEERGPENVIPFPIHRRGTIEDTFSGFAHHVQSDDWFGTRSVRRVSVLFAELRGWRTITDRVGTTRAQQVMSRVVGRTLQTLSWLGARDITLGGEPMQPVVSCTFDGDGHALRALRAAVAVREEAGRAQFPAPAGHQFQVCTGVNTGEIVDADIGGGARMTFQSVGTIQSFAARLQDFAGPGQIFLSSETYRETVDAVRVLSIGEVRVNAAGEKREAFLLLEVLAESGSGDRPEVSPAELDHT